MDSQFYSCYQSVEYYIRESDEENFIPRSPSFQQKDFSQNLEPYYSSFEEDYCKQADSFQCDINFTNESCEKQNQVVVKSTQPNLLQDINLPNKNHIKKKYITETKNLTKFFGPKLFEIISPTLKQGSQILIVKRELNTIKGLKKLWLQSPEILQICKSYFESRQPVIDIMQSERIADKKAAFKHIGSFLRAIENPNGFYTLKL